MRHMKKRRPDPAHVLLVENIRQGSPELVNMRYLAVTEQSTNVRFGVYKSNYKRVSRDRQQITKRCSAISKDF